MLCSSRSLFGIGCAQQAPCLDPSSSKHYYIGQGCFGFDECFFLGGGGEVGREDDMSVDVVVGNNVHHGSPATKNLACMTLPPWLTCYEES